MSFVLENVWVQNDKLAEIVGIMLGDGCLFFDYKKKYHTIITLHKEELAYANYVRELFQSFFAGYSFCFREIPSARQIVNVSVRIGSFLVKQGLIPGNKVVNQVGVPKWIFSRKEHLITFLRGIFDTDGCMYNKYYWYLQVQFKFASLPLIEGVRDGLLSLGFHPTNLQEDVSGSCFAWKFYCHGKKRFMNV